MTNDKMLDKYDVRVVFAGDGVTMNVKRRDAEEDFREFTIDEGTPLIEGARHSDLVYVVTQDYDEAGSPEWKFVDFMYGASELHEQINKKLLPTLGECTLDLASEEDITDISMLSFSTYDTFLYLAQVCTEWIERHKGE